MKLKDIMTREVEVVRPDSTLQEAATKMKGIDVGPMPVCDGDRLVGMLTDRDITVRAVAEGCDPKSTKVRDVMTPDVFWCFEDQDVRDAAKLMQDKQIRRLIVLNRDKRLTGIVALGDIAVDTRDTGLAGRTVEGISEPSQPQI
jgi:CBS domain-containing protein